MSLLKVSDKMVVASDAKVKISNVASFDETLVWTFSQPSGPATISGFSIGFAPGTVIVNWDAGSQSLQSNQPVNINV